MKRLPKVTSKMRANGIDEEEIERWLHSRVISIFGTTGQFLTYVCNNTKYDDETKYLLIWLVSEASEKEIKSVISIFSATPKIGRDDFECLKIAVQKSKK